MPQRYPDASNKYPDNIENGRQTTRLPRYFPHVPPKGKQRKEPYLKTLYAEWNTNDSQTQQKSADHILDKWNKASEDEPQNITE